MHEELAQNGPDAKAGVVTPENSHVDPVQSDPKPVVAQARGDDETLVQVGEELAAKIRECQAYSLGWLIKAGMILQEYRQQLPHGDMSAIFRSGRMPFGQRQCQMLARIAGNQAFRDPALLQKVPQSIAALNVLAGLDAGRIQKGVRDGTIHARLTLAGARALAGRGPNANTFVKNPWPNIKIV